MTTISSVAPAVTSAPPKIVSDEAKKAEEAARQANQRLTDQADQEARRTALSERHTGTASSPPNLVDIFA